MRKQNDMSKKPGHLLFAQRFASNYHCMPILIMCIADAKLAGKMCWSAWQ